MKRRSVLAMTVAPKGQMQLDAMVSQAVTGPVGLPTDQPIATHAPSQAVALGAGEPGREKKGTVASRDVTVGRRENRMGSKPATLPASVRTGRYALVAAIGLAFLCGTAAAEEGGSGHYLPGSMASFVDGVVEYDSAHIDDVASEIVVRSPHSCQSNPHTIEEVRRILLENLGTSVLRGATEREAR